MIMVLHFFLDVCNVVPDVCFMVYIKVSEKKWFVFLEVCFFFFHLEFWMLRYLRLILVNQKYVYLDL